MSKTNCPHCGVGIQFKPERAGSSVKCPKCQERFTLPDDDDALPIPDLVIAADPPASLATALPHRTSSHPPDWLLALRPDTPQKMSAWIAVGTFLVVVVGMGIAYSFSPAGIISMVFETIIAACVVTGLLAVYGAPAILARVRRHKNLVPLVIINVAFGWTVIAWIGCLAWSFSSNADGFPAPHDGDDVYQS